MAVGYTDLPAFNVTSKRGVISVTSTDWLLYGDGSGDYTGTYTIYDQGATGNSWGARCSIRRGGGLGQ